MIYNYCLMRGDNQDYKIIIAGYEGEYARLIEAGWNVEAWEAGGGYQADKTAGNRFRERLFLSPSITTPQEKLF